MASDKAPPAVVSIHTPSSSIALVHSVSTESLTSLFDKLSGKKHTEFYGKRVGPGWLKYEWSDSVWNLDDDGDYSIFQWRQNGSTNLPIVYLKDPSELLPPYRNPSFYLLRPDHTVPVQPSSQSDSTVLGKRIRSADELAPVQDEWRTGWHQLRDDNPWKLFGDYWRNQKVGTTHDSPSIVLAYEESGRKNPEYRLPLAPEVNNEIIVRDCYRPIYDFIRKAVVGFKHSGFVLTGQPGTGKTMWLSYALVRLLTENKPVAYHYGAGTYLFFGNSVYSRAAGVAIKFPPAVHATICLIDLDPKEDVDTTFMTNRTLIGNTFPVVASSPNPSRYNILRKQRAPVPIEIMPLWTSDELKHGFKMQRFFNGLRKDVETVLRTLPVDDNLNMAIPPSIKIEKDWLDQILSALQMIRDERDDNAKVEVEEVLDKILDNAIEEYGPSTRDVYVAILSPTRHEDSITNAIAVMMYEDRRAVATLPQVDSGIGDRTISHCIFSIHVTAGFWHAHKKSEVQFKSRWIKSSVLRHLEFLQHLDTAFLIKEMRALSFTFRFADFL